MIVLLGVCVGLIPVIHSIWLLVGMIFLIGIMQSNLDVGGNTLLVWLHGNKVAPFMNSLHFFFGLGSFIAPLIIAQSLRGTQTINIAFWIMSILIILPVPFFLSLKSPENPDESKSITKENARPKSDKRIISLLIMFFLFFAGAEITFSNWIYTHGLKSGFLTIETSAYLTSAFWGTFMIGRFLGIGVSRRFTSLQIIWVDLIGGLSSLLLMLVFPNSVLVLWVCSALIGLFVATRFPTGMNLAEEMNAVSARITSLFFVAASISAMISPWIVGQFIERSNSQILIWVVMINLILATVAMLGIQLLNIKRLTSSPT